MKITLISIYPDHLSFGVRTMSACLKQAGHDVDLIFLMKEFWDKYEEKTLNDLVKLTKESDLVGISLMTNFFDNAIQITQKLKDNYEFPILWGGTHPTIRPEECLEYADMVCIGESEETFVELANKIQNEQHYYDTKGMGFNVKGKIIVNKHRELPGSKNAAIKSLDQIPFQDIDYKNHFTLNGENIVKMDEKVMRQLAGVYMTLPTRGCPFACTFCVNNFLLDMHPHQKPIRMRSVDHIIMELQEVKRKLPFTKVILFNDDAFFLMPLGKIKEFSKKYKEHIRLPLIVAGATPSTLTKEKLSVLVDGGLIEMRMGIQTMAEKTKKLYKRPHSNSHVEKAVRMVNEYKDKVKVRYDIILDSPFDTNENSIETLMFLAKLPTPYQLNLFSLVFFPGTDLYRKAKEEGVIKDDLNDVYRKHYGDEGCKKTYLNSLFFLLNDYTLIGVGISAKIMSYLTNKKTRQLHLHRFLFTILKVIYPFFRMKHLLHLWFTVPSAPEDTDTIAAC